MDLNLVVIAGRLANSPEVRVFDGGSTVTRLLVTCRQGGVDTGKKRRIDVVPVTAWDDVEIPENLERGDRVWVAGSVQRRFWSDDRSRRSRIEVVAHHVQTGIEGLDPIDEMRPDQLDEDRLVDEENEALTERMLNQ